MNKLLFFCISLAILVFSVIVINVAPVIKGKIGEDWSSNSCKMYSDYYNYKKKDTYENSKEKDATLDPIKKAKTRCERRKAMNGLEYVTSNINIIFSFICAFAGYLLYKNISSDGKYIGLIGLGFGVVGFVLTLVYVIESGLVFTDISVDDDYKEARIDSDGAILEWNGSKNRYTCIYYKEDDEDSLYLKFSDYGNKYLNYKKEIFFSEEEKNYKYEQCNYHDKGYFESRDILENCQILFEEGTCPSYYSDYSPDFCDFFGKIEYYDDDGNRLGTCDKIYYFNEKEDNNVYKETYDFWLTSLIFNCLIMVLYLGLALFGFLIFKESSGSGGSGGVVSIK